MQITQLITDVRCASSLPPHDETMLNSFHLLFRWTPSSRSKAKTSTTSSAPPTKCAKTWNAGTSSPPSSPPPPPSPAHI